MFRFIGKRKRKEQQEDQHVHLKWAIEAQRQAKEADQNTDEQMQRADNIAAESKLISAADEFIETYRQIFAPKRRGNRIWPHG